MLRRSAFTLIELLIVILLIALLLSCFLSVIQKRQDSAVATELMEDTTLPQTPEAARIIDELAKKVFVGAHEAHYHAILNIPVERFGEVTGSMVIAALEKGAHAWAACHDMEIIAYAWSREGRDLRAKFSVRKK